MTRLPGKTVTLLWLIFAACAPALTAVTRSSERAGRAQVEFLGAEGGVVRLLVHNASPSLMVINRDAFEVRRVGGILTRSQGGAGSTYLVAPGGSHAVNLRFDLDALNPGEPLYLTFDKAISIESQFVSLDPLPLRLD